MDDKYADYLGSEAWRAKRSERLEIGNHRCAACESSVDLQVHHLTYARIYNEDMADLLPLCKTHHMLAEELSKSGMIPKEASVLFLATETVRLILSHDAACKKIFSRRKENSKLEEQRIKLHKRFGLSPRE